MATCGDCHRPVIWRRMPDGALRAFDPVPAMRGPDRYVDVPGRGLVHVAREDADVSAQQLHRATCGQGHRG